MQFYLVKYPTEAAAITAETNANPATSLWCGVSTVGHTIYREGVYLYLQAADIQPLPWPSTDGSKPCCRAASLVSAEALDIQDAAEALAITNGHLQ